MKKFLQFAAVAAVVFVFTSCSVESKTKGYLEQLEQYKVEKAELVIEMQEASIEHLEYLEDLDKKDLRKVDKNGEKWMKEVYKEYKDEKEDLEKQRDKILEKSYKVWDDEIVPRLLEIEENKE